MNATVSSSRNPSLDGLRGLAIAGVLLFHTGQLAGGFLGVDLFFVLSGYLITGLLLRERTTTGTVSLTTFWGRRARRLLPALATMLAVTAVATQMIGEPDLIRTTLSDGPWVQADLINWHLLADSAGYWDRFGSSRVFEHLWSIAVEEQFYLAWPLLLLAVTRRTGRPHRRVVIAAAAGIAASLLISIVLLDPSDPSRVYTGTDTRASSLLVGALVATDPIRRLLARIPGWAARIAVPALMALITVSWLITDGTGTRWLYRGGLLGHATACAVLIGLIVSRPDALLSRVFRFGPLCRLGLISYGLYLWHWPVIVLLSPQRTGLTGWPWTVAVLTVSIAIAEVSKRLVEDPIRFTAGWARGRSGLIAFISSMAGLAALWLLLPAPQTTIDLTGLR